MSKYEVGSYTVTLFDRVGGKISSKSLDNCGYTVARAFGKARISSGDCHSFTISRVLYNSLIFPPEKFDIADKL
jgi:hypothetical protein